MKIGIDTNIFVYLAGLDDEGKHRLCLALFERFDAGEIIVPLLVLMELHYVLSRKKKDKAFASTVVSLAARQYQVADMTAATLRSALDLVAMHQFQIFDAMILAQCAASDCGILLTEDLHDGFEWKGCTIVSPFRDPQHPLLTRALARS